MSAQTSGVQRRPSAKAVHALAACFALGVLGAAPVHAANLSYEVSFDDPAGLASGFYDAIGAQVGAALDQWSPHLIGTANFDIRVVIDDSIPRATGRSMASSFLLNVGGYDIYEQGMAHELRTGVDINGDLPDIEISLNPGYINDELWFDPSPHDRIEPVAKGRTDATSVFLHELGHALGFNGWGDGSTGQLPGNYASTWDAWVREDNGTLFFNGPLAQAAHGGPVPITQGLNFHLGNVGGPDLRFDVMGGVSFDREHRYQVSLLDLAILRDMGVPVAPWPPIVIDPLPAPAVPEPSTVVLLPGGLLALEACRRVMARIRGA